MTERLYAHLEEAELFDAWERAYKLWAQDYRVVEARALVDQLSQEIKSRGLRRPILRVGLQISAIATQIRMDGNRNTAAVSQDKLSVDLDTFVAKRNTRPD